MKIIAITIEDIVIGLHIVGDASDKILQGFAATINIEAKKSDFHLTVAIHQAAA